MRKLRKEVHQMSYEAFCEKEEALNAAKENVSEAAGALEEILPETAEELNWIRGQLVRELIDLHTRMQEAADVGELH
jgi:DNA polymerase III delta prime subunit